VVVRSADDGLLRSRNLDLYNQPVLPAGLYFYKPSSGHAFVSISHLPGFIGTRTAFNETGLNIGAHDISRFTPDYSILAGLIRTAMIVTTKLKPI
jgi:hypothetical protein